MEYNVVLEKFEGPFDLLFHLIEKNEVDIYDIPIAEITNQYIDYLENMKVLDLEITSEFLVMAATLLEIKSKMLLPRKKDEGEQLELEEVDPRQELVRRLIEYKRYKDVAEELKTKEEIQKKVFFKPQEELEYFYEDSNETILEGVEIEDLFNIFINIVNKKKNIKEVINVKEIQRDEITIEDCVSSLRNTIISKRKIKFNDLFEGDVTRVRLVVTFLSILELIKLKEVRVKQEKNFGDIIIIANKT